MWTCVARRVSRRACACLRASALTPGQAEGGVRVSPRRGIASHPVPRGIAGAPHVLQARGKECHQRRELQRIALGTHGEGRGGGWGTSPALNLGRTTSEWLSSWANPTNEYKIWHSTICCCSKTGSTPRTRLRAVIALPSLESFALADVRGREVPHGAVGGNCMHVCGLARADRRCACALRARCRRGRPVAAPLSCTRPPTNPQPRRAIVCSLTASQSTA